MNGDEIRKWAEAYDESYQEELHEIEQTLHEALQAQGYITQEQLRDVVTWKLDNQAGRRSGNIERVNQVPDAFVRRVSEAALLVGDPEVQLKTLSSIPGIGYATATVVLTFYDPERYAVGDRYMVDLFFGEDRQMRVTDYPKLLSELRDRNPGGFDLRTVEKAYYQRYREVNGIA
jgi:transglutaminase-like putative cysteine protease